MLHLYSGTEMENKYKDRIVYDADTYFIWNEVQNFSQDELNVIAAIDGAIYCGDGLFKSKFVYPYPHNAGDLSMGCRMLLNLMRNTKKDGKDIYDMTNAGPNVIKYLFSMKEYAEQESRNILLNYPGFKEVPTWGIYFNDDGILYKNFDELYLKFVGALSK